MPQLWQHAHVCAQSRSVSAQQTVLFLSICKINFMLTTLFLLYHAASSEESESDDDSGDSNDNDDVDVDRQLVARNAVALAKAPTAAQTARAMLNNRNNDDDDDDDDIDELVSSDDDDDDVVVAAVAAPTASKAAPKVVAPKVASTTTTTAASKENGVANVVAAARQPTLPGAKLGSRLAHGAATRLAPTTQKNGVLCDSHVVV